MSCSRAHPHSLLGRSLPHRGGLHDRSLLCDHGDLRADAHAWRCCDDGVRYVFFCAIHVDAQKYYTLQNKKQLITDGMFRYIRSPNYLGEVMIYSSYALLANVEPCFVCECSIGFPGSFSSTCGRVCSQRASSPRRSAWSGGGHATSSRLDTRSGSSTRSGRMVFFPSSSLCISSERRRRSEFYRVLSLFSLQIR